MAKFLPLTVSSKTAELQLDGEAVRVNPFANAGITAADAPVLLSLASKKTVDADTFAGRMVKAGGQGTKAEARLFMNSFAAVLGDFVDEYGAITVQTPFGTVQTFIAGTLENAQDQPDPAVNYAFLGVVIPETYRRLFAQIETYVPADACPASLKRVRDKATNAKGICGTSAFYLEGVGMTIGGEGETLELLDAVTRDKLCDISVDAESKSPSQFLCTLVPQTELAAGTYLLRLVTRAGGEPGSEPWPVELKVELLEAIPAPTPVGPTLTKLYPTNEPTKVGIVPRDGTMIVEGSGLAGAAVTVDYTDKGDEHHADVSVSDSEYYADEDKLDFGGADWEVLCKSMKPGSEVTLKVTTDDGTATITGTSDEE